MRLVPLTFALLLGLAAVSLMPQAAAYPPVCIERNVQQGPVTAHVGQCGDQSVHVVSCGSGSAQRIYYAKDVGPANVLVDVCIPHMPPP
jgi:hypothetical protein